MRRNSNNGWDVISKSSGKQMARWNETHKRFPGGNLMKDKEETEQGRLGEASDDNTGLSHVRGEWEGSSFG